MYEAILWDDPFEKYLESQMKPTTVATIAEMLTMLATEYSV